MKKAIAILVISAAGCMAAGDLHVSPWSKPSNGLKIQVASPASFPRRQGWAHLEVTCTITNVGSSATNVSHLARLYLVDKEGITNSCQRHEDTMDMVPARPSVAPGQTTSWKQDGQCQAKEGSYRLFAVWDRDKELRSPAIAITVK